MCKVYINVPENTFGDYEITPKRMEKPTLFLVRKKKIYKDIRLLK